MPYRSLLLVLVLLFCCNWAALAEEEQAKPAKLTEKSFRFDPAARGLSVGIHLDEENGYLYALVKNAGPDDVTINTFRIKHWEFWQLEITSGKDWQLVPFADTIFKTTYGIATSAKDRKNLRPAETVTNKSETLEIPILHRADNVLVGHQHCALPSNRKANRNEPLPGATVAIDFLDLEWPSELRGEEITIRIAGSIFVDETDGKGYKLQRIISPEIRLNVAALKKLLRPDFSIRLAQNMEKPGFIDVHLRNITANPITLSGNSSAPWNPGLWFNIEVNGKRAKYVINIAAIDNPSRKNFNPNEEKLFTQIYIPLLRFTGELDGGTLRAAPGDEVSTIVVSGRIIQASSSEPLKVKPTE